LNGSFGMGMHVQSFWLHFCNLSQNPQTAAAHSAASGKRVCR
jgi:hypothetical protein